MLESVLIQNFKGFKNTSVGPFRMVNLIIGGQNVGKTSLLEAVFASVSIKPYHAVSMFRQAEDNDEIRFNKLISTPGFFVKSLMEGGTGLAVSAKQMQPDAVDECIGRETRYREINYLEFPDQSSTNDSQIEVRNAGIFHHEFRAWDIGGGITRNYFSCEGVPCVLPTQAQLVRLFGQVIIARKKKDLINLLKKIDVRLESLDAISPDGHQRIYAELEGFSEAIPINMLGHGFSRLVYLFSQLFSSNAQLALIDEIENGIHYSALPTLFQGIKAVAQERQVQSLITTHSWDCLRAACEVFEDAPDMFQVIRLERTDDNVRAVCIHGEQLLRMVRDDMEVR